MPNIKSIYRYRKGVSDGLRLAAGLIDSTGGEGKRKRFKIRHRHRYGGSLRKKGAPIGSIIGPGRIRV